MKTLRSWTILVLMAETAACGDPGGHGSLDPQGDSVLVDSSDSTYAEGDAGRAQDGEPQAAAAPFSKPFSQLVRNKASWGSFAVELLAARVERGMDQSWTDDVKYPPIRPDEVYVELDVALSNRTPRDNALGVRNTWDLILPDGTRIEQGNYVGAALSPAGTVPVTLRYPVDEQFQLAGCQLELNGHERGELQPERIPLDIAYVADIDAALPELEGKAFEGDESGASRRRITFLSARVTRNSITAERAGFGTMFVDMNLDITAEKGATDVFDEHFRVDVAGRAYAPAQKITKILGDGLTATIPVVFALPDDVRQFAVRFRVGRTEQDDEEWLTVPVALGD